MRSLIFCLALLALIAFAPSAFALTIDNESGLNADGTAKFSDPDDNKPGFMTGATNAPSSSLPSSSMDLSQGNSPHMNFTVDHAGGGNSQKDAFDEAYGSK